jgi:hypothetical protein
MSIYHFRPEFSIAAQQVYPAQKRVSFTEGTVPDSEVPASLSCMDSWDFDGKSKKAKRNSPKINYGKK